MVMFGFAMPYTYITVYAEDAGLSNSEAYLLLSVVGLASGAGRIATGYVADYIGRLLMVRVTMVLAAVVTFIWAGLTSFVALMLYSIFFGFFKGGFIGLRPTVAAALYSDERLATVVGVITTSAFLGRLLSPPIAGWLYLIQGNYNIPIAVAGLYFLVAAAFIDIMCYDLDMRDVNSVQYIPMTTSVLIIPPTDPSLSPSKNITTHKSRIINPAGNKSQNNCVVQHVPFMDNSESNGDIDSCVLSDKNKFDLEENKLKSGGNFIHLSIDTRKSNSNIQDNISPNTNKSHSPHTDRSHPVQIQKSGSHIGHSFNSSSGDSESVPAPRLSQSARSISSTMSTRAINLRRNIVRQASIHFIKVKQAKHISFIIEAINLLFLLKDCLLTLVIGLCQSDDNEEEDEDEDTQVLREQNESNIINIHGDHNRLSLHDTTPGTLYIESKGKGIVEGSKNQVSSMVEKEHEDDAKAPEEDLVPV